jgi:hypothetical protein
LTVSVALPLYPLSSLSLSLSIFHSYLFHLLFGCRRAFSVFTITSTNASRSAREAKGAEEEGEEEGKEEAEAKREEADDVADDVIRELGFLFGTGPVETALGTDDVAVAEALFPFWAISSVCNFDSSSTSTETMGGVYIRDRDAEKS